MKRILLITCGIIAIAFFGFVIVSFEMEENNPIVFDKKPVILFNRTDLGQYWFLHF